LLELRLEKKIMMIDSDNVEMLCGDALWRRSWVDDRLWGRVEDLFVFRVIKAGETR